MSSSQKRKLLSKKSTRRSSLAFLPATPLSSGGGEKTRTNRAAFVASLIGKEQLLKFQECARELADQTLTPEQRATVLLDLINSGRMTSDEVHLFASALIRANEASYA